MQNRLGNSNGSIHLLPFSVCKHSKGNGIYTESLPDGTEVSN